VEYDLAKGNIAGVLSIGMPKTVMQFPKSLVMPFFDTFAPTKHRNQQTMLLILDLDETLIHATSEPPRDDYHFEVDRYAVFKRPHLDAFLAICAQHFDLAIWSSASDDYVQAIVAQIIPATIPLKFVWGRSRCTPRTAFQLDKYGSDETRGFGHYEYAKHLKKLKRRGYDLRQVLIVDDTPAKVRNAYGNAIYVRPFQAEEEDDELRLLSDYLVQLKDREDMRRIEKRRWREEMRNRP
jgi:carboxy-terminal domain RNA polymerase II polypeptide A small phosphatase